MRFRLILLVATLALVAPVAARQDVSRAEADRMLPKVEAIVARAIAPPKSTAKPLRTSFTDRELTAYLRFHAQDQLPTGVRQPRITMLDGGKVETRAIVDLDAVRTAEPRGWLDPLAYATGSLEVAMIGVFRGTKGQGLYIFESGTVGGVPLPKAMLQELVAFYTRSPDLPAGVHLDQPFDLPAAIREVEVRRGAATVIQ